MWNNEKELKMFFEILLSISSYHYLRIVVNDIYRP